jgi:glycosyltransferase involved in cell wall biosynthesis
MPASHRLRVLVVIGTMGGGGAERQVIEILKRIDRSRFEPLLYLAMRQGELLAEIPVDVPVFAFWDGAAESWGGMLVRRLKLTRFARYIHLARVLHCQKIDVVYDRTYLATLDAAGGCWLRPTPRISCCVVDPEPELKLHARRSIRLSWWFARRAYRTASIVLANSEGLRLRLLDYFRLDPNHVRTFYNLLTGRTGDDCDPSGDPPAVPDLPWALSSAGPRVTPFLIVTVGRLHPQKGHRFLLEALEILVQQRTQPPRLVILGQGELEAELQAFVASHQLGAHVTLMGFVADPGPWLRRANLFVLPSLYEGMPNALIEAAACGTPVLATDCPSGPAEILDGGRCGVLVPVADSAALAVAMADAMDHPDQWRARAELARQRVQELFNAEAGMRRFEQLVEQTAGRD